MDCIEKRRERRHSLIMKDIALGSRLYNLLLAFFVLYGIGMNVLLCYLVGDMVNAINPYLFLMGFFVVFLVGIMLVNFSNSTLLCFLGYNLSIAPLGLMFSGTVSDYIENRNGAIISQALVVALFVAAGLIFLASYFPKFSTFVDGLRDILEWTNIILLVLLIVTFFIPAISTFTYWIMAILFAFYVAYDYRQAQKAETTLDNAIANAFNLYLDILNLFLAFLRIKSSNK